MKKLMPGALLCALCFMGMVAACALSHEPAPSSLSTVPFARKVDSDDVIYLCMNRDVAEEITGMPVEEGAFGKQMFIYEGITLAYRDDLVVYIQIHADGEQWAANGVIVPGMPTEQAVDALGMVFEEESDLYTLGYFEDGAQRQLHPGASAGGSKGYQWALTLFGKQTVGMIDMGDRQYLLTRQ